MNVPDGTFQRDATATNATWNAVTPSCANNGYHLPTESEWMWAAMGATCGTTEYAKAFAGSTGGNAIGHYAVYGYYGSGVGKTANEQSNPGDSKLPTELSLYDMSGNVWEWSWDWYATYS